MAMFVLRRLALAVLTVFVTTTLVFFITAALPGDPARTILGTQATPQRVAELNAKLGLNHPIWQQYGDWLNGLLHGSLGKSVANGQPVWDVLAPRFGHSALLLLIVTLIAFPLAFGLGVITAARRSSLFDSATNTVSLVVVALPEFVVAIGLVYLLAGGVFRMFPAVSTVFPGQSLFSRPEVLVLPALSATIVVIPYMMRMVRAVVIEVLDSEYIEMSRLSGLSNRRVLLRHALPNALPPVTQVCALILVYLLGGLVIVESVFGYPGIGSQLVSAVQVRDLPQVQGIAVVLVSMAVLFYLIADVVAVSVSPRSRTAL